MLKWIACKKNFAGGLLWTAKIVQNPRRTRPELSLSQPPIYPSTNFSWCIFCRVTQNTAATAAASGRSKSLRWAESLRIATRTGARERKRERERERYSRQYRGGALAVRRQNFYMFNKIPVRRPVSNFLCIYVGLSRGQKRGGQGHLL